MKPPFPCPVSTWHNDIYDAIDPKRKELSCEGKTVLVTGAGGSIGRETAIAFATAGAKHVALIGRTIDSLKETQTAIAERSATPCSVHPADVTDEASMAGIASQIGTWDVFVQNAGYTSVPSKIVSADLDDYWKSFEVNVKAVLIAAKVFMATANPDRAVLLGVSSGALNFPTKMTAGLSSYLVSKMALARTLEYLSVENPNLFTATIHPGMVESAVFYKSGAKPDKLPMDSPRLAANFMLWMSSPEASGLDGKFVWANWDVTELKAAEEDINKKGLLTLTTSGWPYSVL